MVGICLLSAAVSSIVGECSTAYRPPARSADDACRRAKPPAILLCSTARMERVAESPHVVVANYGLLQRDFQELRDLTEDAIDAWLVEEAGWTRDSRALARSLSLDREWETEGGRPGTVHARDG